MQVNKNIIIPGVGHLPITCDIFFNTNAGKQPVIIFAHGFNGFKDWGNADLLAVKFVNAGFTFVKFNFSHNGTTPDLPDEFADLDSFGKNNYTKQLADVLSVTNWVADINNPYHHAIDANSIFLIGHSMGAGISIIFSSEDIRIKKLVTWAGISECKTPWGDWPAEKIKTWELTGVQYYSNTRTNQQMPLYYQLYQDYQENKERLNIKNALMHLNISFLICHGEFDIAVPVEKAYQLKQWHPAAELFIVDSNHVFDRRHPWIVNYLPDAMEQVVEKTIQFLQ